MDDPSPAPLLHFGDQRPGQTHGVGQVELHEVVPVFVLDLVDSLGNIPARIVHENVNVAHAGKGLRGEAIGILTSGDVGSQPFHSLPGALRKLLSRFADGLFRAAANKQIGACLGENLGNGPTDAATCTCDQRGSPCKAENGISHGDFPYQASK